MSRYSVCLVYFFTSLICFAQQNDTLKQHPVSTQQNEIEDIKLNKEALDAIRNNTFIGPQPERRRPDRFLEKEVLERVPNRILNEDDWINPDSIPSLQISDYFIKQLKAESKIHHRKTTVNDTQTLANPHIRLSFNDILCFLFRPDLRIKMQNKKRAHAYKTY